MSKPDVAAILNLPVQERLRLVELIWQSLAAEPSAIPPTDAQRAVLLERLSEHERDPHDVLTIEQVLEEARRDG